MKVALFVIFLLFSVEYSYTQNERTWLWKIEKKGVRHVSYLFGTFHEAGNSIFDSFKGANKCLLKSDVLFIESRDTTTPADITQDDVDKGFLIWHNLLSKDQLQTFVRYATKFKYAAYFAMPGAEIAINLHHDYIRQFCTKYVKDTLFVMDYQIQLLAQKYNLAVTALDDSIGYEKERLISPLDNIAKTDTSIIRDMIETMEYMLTGKENGMPCTILDEYINCDFGYAFDIRGPDQPFSLNARNVKWMNIISPALLKQRCFIAVGFSHLRYSTGLIKQLQKRGFKLTPIKMK